MLSSGVTITSVASKQYRVITVEVGFTKCKNITLFDFLLENGVVEFPHAGETSAPIHVLRTNAKGWPLGITW